MKSIRSYLSDFFGRDQDIAIIRRILTKHNLAKSSSILDFGCGSGRLATSLLNDGYRDMYAYDLNPDTFIDFKGAVKRFFAIEDVLSHLNTFDAIVLMHVIEHIPPSEVAELLDSLIEVLSPNGILIVASPTNYPLFYNDLDHIKPYTPLALTSLFCRSDTIYKTNTKKLLKPQYLRFRIRPIVFTDWQGVSSMAFDTSFIDSLISYSLNTLAALAFILSFGLISTRSAWFASFTKCSVR